MDSPEPRTVLVVEDGDVTRGFLLDNLAADGFRVAGASGEGEGLRAIEVRQPALVVPDLLLDDGSGLALLDRVRASDGLSSRIDPDLPVIVLERSLRRRRSRAQLRPRSRRSPE
jgi:CheY-like chemotaxis protein